MSPRRPANGSLLKELEGGDVAALARAISLIENGRDGYEALLSALHPKLGRAHRIGITGPPGAGKSTLTERLVLAYREQGLTVAVVAVDPTSPFSGGALLGDRIRMESAAQDPGVFIRSMATRGAVGGTAATTREVCDALDAFGFERIIIETVGVGQSELAIAATADTVVLVLVPESGDSVQVLKAGVMEIADIFVVNKADRPGADRLRQEIEVMLGIRKGNAFRHVGAHHRPETPPTVQARRGVKAQVALAKAQADDFEPPVLGTVATVGDGVPALVEAVEAHAKRLRQTGELARRRRQRLERHTREVVDRSIRHHVWEEKGEATLAAGLDKMVRGSVSPYEVAQAIVKRVIGKERGK